MGELKHVGILGMKWGRRKAPNSTDYEEARVLRKKKTKQMTNKELETFLKRADLETRMKKIKGDDVVSGTKKINAVLETIGKVAATVTTVAVLAKKGQKVYEVLKKAKKVAGVGPDYNI